MTESTFHIIDNFSIEENQGDVYCKVMNDTEKKLIEKVLAKSFGNQSIASKLLGINRNTLRQKIKKFNINTKNFRI